MDDRAWQRIVATLATLVMLGAVAWMELPEWQRDLMVRGAKLRAYRLLHRVARASGRRAMGDELAGRQDEAEAGYRQTEWLSRWRDRV